MLQPPSPPKKPKTIQPSPITTQPPPAPIIPQSITLRPPLQCPPHHRWPKPWKLHLAIDSTGKTQGSKKRDYTRHIVNELALDNIELNVSYIPGADLPALTRAIKSYDVESDAHFLVSMCNSGVATIDQEDVMPPDIFAACDVLSQMRAPVKIIYGGPGEMWKSIRGKHHIFEQKAGMVREYLNGLGMDVESGADDYRSQFCLDDLDGLGHFLGSQCGERPTNWLQTLILRYSYKLWMDNCGVAQHSSESSFSGCAKNKIARLNPPEPLETLGVWIPRIHPLSLSCSSHHKSS